MPLGISPLNDFAFKKSFGTIANKPALISLLNSILRYPSPILDLTIENPYNIQDFQEDKLSILDLKVVDQAGVIYNVEVQLAVQSGLLQRLVFYGCELYAGQLVQGEDYTKLNRVVTICLLNGVLWKDSSKVHHAFRLTDRDSGRILDPALEIHTLELGWYNQSERDFATASLYDCWLYWLLQAQNYEPEQLLALFPQPSIQLASRSLIHIAEISEDKMMYDAREKAIRDREWMLNNAVRSGLEQGKIEGRLEGEIEGKIQGEMKLIRILEELLGGPITAEEELQALKLDQLTEITAGLQAKLRERKS